MELQEAVDRLAPTVDELVVQMKNAGILVGISHSPLSCPLARLLREWTERQVIVGSRTAATYRLGPGEAIETKVQLPLAAQAFIALFDKAPDKASLAVSVVLGEDWHDAPDHTTLP